MAFDRRSSKENINIIGYRIARIVHLHQPPVFAFTGDLERVFAVACTRSTTVYVADLRNYRPLENELFRVDRFDSAVDPYEIAVTAALLLTPDLVNAAFVSNCRNSEIIPTYPLQRKFMLARKHLRGRRIVDDCRFLSNDRTGRKQ